MKSLGMRNNRNWGRRLGLRLAQMGTVFLMSPLAQGPALANAFLPVSSTTTAVPANGDSIPLGVVFIPPEAVTWTNSKVRPGDILVSNYANAAGTHDTGTSIIQYTPSSVVFPQLDAQVFSGTVGPGPNLALGVLKRGSILVGAVNVGLQVLNPAGAVVQTIANGGANKINGPWGLAVADHLTSASIFVSNVGNGTVTRLDVTTSATGVLNITNATTIADGFPLGLVPADPLRYYAGPAGLAYNSLTDTLYVASEATNSIDIIYNASKITSTVSARAVFAVGGNLRGPAGLALAPNGDLIVANSDARNADPNHPSEILEFTPFGQFVSQYNLSDAPYAAFGVAVAPPGLPPAAATYNFATVNDLLNTVTVQGLK
jgi:hypothetical protein